MTIHHKFIALFNATPGSYAQNPAFNDTATLLPYVEDVTAVDITEDNAFIDHVLSNFSFSEEEDSELWQVARNAMTELVETVGRVGAVDTAIEFLMGVGSDPTSDYFFPANRFVRKANGSELATEANQSQSDPEILLDVFANSPIGPINTGTLANGNELTLPRTLAWVDDTSLIPLTDEVDGVDTTQLMPADVSITTERMDFRNSSKHEDLTVLSTGRARFGDRNSEETFKSIVDFNNTTITVNNDSGFQVGISDDGQTTLMPSFTLRATDSTLETTGSVTVAAGWSGGSHGRLELQNSTLGAGNDLRVGNRDEDDLGETDFPVIGSLLAADSVIELSDDLRIGEAGGQGAATLENTTVTVDDIRLASNNSIFADDQGASYTSSLIGQATLNITDGSVVTADEIALAKTSGGDATATFSDSEFTIARLRVADLDSQNASAVLDLDSKATLTISGSTLALNRDNESGDLKVGGGARTSGSLQITDSVLTGIDDLQVGYAGGMGELSFDSSTLNLQDNLEVGNGRDTDTNDSVGVFSASDSTLNINGVNSYIGIGDRGAEGSVSLDNTTLNFITSETKTENDFSGQYYRSVQIGYGNSGELDAGKPEGTLQLTNGSTFTQGNTESGNTSLFFAVGRSDDGELSNGKVSVESGSTLQMINLNPDIHEVALQLGSRANTDGILTVDGANTVLRMASEGTLVKLDVGDNAEGIMRVANGALVEINAANAGYVRVGNLSGSDGELTVSGADTRFIGNENTTLTIGERPEEQFNADPLYEQDLDASSFEGATGSVLISEGATVQFGIAGDGIADIFVGDGGSLEVAEGATLIGDIQVIGTGTVSENLEGQLL